MSSIYSTMRIASFFLGFGILTSATSAFAFEITDVGISDGKLEIQVSGDREHDDCDEFNPILESLNATIPSFRIKWNRQDRSNRMACGNFKGTTFKLDIPSAAIGGSNSIWVVDRKANIQITVKKGIFKDAFLVELPERFSYPSNTTGNTSRQVR